MRPESMRYVGFRVPIEVLREVDGLIRTMDDPKTALRNSIAPGRALTRSLMMRIVLEKGLESIKKEEEVAT